MTDLELNLVIFGGTAIVVVITVLGFIAFERWSVRETRKPKDREKRS